MPAWCSASAPTSEGLSLQRRAASAKPDRVKLRRLLPLLTLLALLVAPFGRIAAAEAMMVPQQPMAAMSGHCDDMPAPAQHRGDRTHKASIDCLVACAAMATAENVPLVQNFAVVSMPAGYVLPEFSGLHPEADPPPPRLS